MKLSQWENWDNQCESSTKLGCYFFFSLGLKNLVQVWKLAFSDTNYSGKSLKSNIDSFIDGSVDDFLIVQVKLLLKVNVVHNKHKNWHFREDKTVKLRIIFSISELVKKSRNQQGRNAGYQYGASRNEAISSNLASNRSFSCFFLPFSLNKFYKHESKCLLNCRSFQFIAIFRSNIIPIL